MVKRALFVYSWTSRVPGWGNPAATSTMLYYGSAIEGHHLRSVYALYVIMHIQNNTVSIMKLSWEAPESISEHLNTLGDLEAGCLHEHNREQEVRAYQWNMTCSSWDGTFCPWWRGRQASESYPPAEKPVRGHGRIQIIMQRTQYSTDSGHRLQRDTQNYLCIRHHIKW